jgi:hypothetical protein
MKLTTTAALLSLMLVAGTTASATTTVSFVQPERYADAGNTPAEEPKNLEVLAGHLQLLGAQLPATQTLRIDVLDIDLAGEVSPRRISPPLRVAGNADWPRIHLRYSLEQDGRVLRSGDEWLKDLHYSRTGIYARRDAPLYYEKRLLDAWFRQRIAAPA